MPFYFSLYFFFFIFLKHFWRVKHFSNIQIEYKIYKNISWNLFMSNSSLQIEWTGGTTKIKLYFTSISILLHLTKLILWCIINKFQMIFFLHLTSNFILINQLEIMNILILYHEQSYCIALWKYYYIILLNIGNISQTSIIMK